jgi:hypothetical protein
LHPSPTPLLRSLGPVRRYAIIGTSEKVCNYSKGEA